MGSEMCIRDRLSPPRQRGVGFALSSIPNTIVGPVASIAAAYIADYFGLYPIFIVTAVTYFIGLGILQLGVKVE